MASTKTISGDQAAKRMRRNAHRCPWRTLENGLFAILTPNGS
jgi:hypothetical protein